MAEASPESNGFESLPNNDTLTKAMEGMTLGAANTPSSEGEEEAVEPVEAPAPAAAAAVAAAPAPAPAATALKAKTPKQAERYAKQRAEQDRLQGMVNAEQANIPEKKRSKATAYDAVSIAYAADPDAKRREVLERYRREAEARVRGEKPPARQTKKAVVAAAAAETPAKTRKSKKSAAAAAAPAPVALEAARDEIRAVAAEKIKTVLGRDAPRKFLRGFMALFDEGRRNVSPETFAEICKHLAKTRKAKKATSASASRSRSRSNKA